MNMKSSLVARLIKVAATVAGALVVASMPVWSSGTAGADASSIEIKSSSVTSEFPDGFRFLLEASHDSDIVSVAVRLKIGQQTSASFNYLCDASGQEAETWRCDELDVGKVVDGELLWRTNSAGNYIPPETLITYSFEIEDSEGNTLETEQEEFIYRDVRYEWKEVSEGPVTVAYHGPVLSRATIVLETIIETIDTMAPLLGAESEGPIRVAVYNNNLEMLGALPRGSATIRRELITEGQAFFEMGVLLMIQGGTRAKGTASHEVTHILVHRAADGIFRRAPSWVQEGLAEYANVEPESGISYELALDFAVATGRLLPVLYMQTLPGDPEDVIIFYGQARSMIRMMVDEWGIDKMNQLMKEMKSGKDMDSALTAVYGFDRQGLDDQWRDSVGAPRYEPPNTEKAKPTPIPKTVVLPFSLTPQAGAEAIGSISAEETPTPTPEPTLAPVAAVAPEQSAQETRDEASNSSDAETSPAETGTSGTGCFALTGGPASADLLTAAMLIGMVGLASQRRRPG